MDTRAHQSSCVWGLGSGPVWSHSIGEGAKRQRGCWGQGWSPTSCPVSIACDGRPPSFAHLPVHVGTFMTLAEVTEKGPVELGGQRLNTERPNPWDPALFPSLPLWF